jgi:hypothetical protein
MSFRTQEEQTKAIEAAHLELEKRKTIETVYAKFPTFLRCEANDKAIIEIITRWAGPDVIPTADLFMFAYEENEEEVIKRMGVYPEAKIRARLIEDILDLLETRGNGHDALSLKTEKSRLATFTTQALHARLAELKVKQQMAGVPVSELKRFVANARKETRRFPGYPDLPATIVPRGQVQAVRCDSVYLLNLARTDYHEYRHLCAKFSTEQITARQQGRI